MRREASMSVTLKLNTYIYFVLLLFLVPIKWLLAWLTAVSFHEFCHWVSVKLCGGEIYGLTVGIGGANMECTPLSNGKRLFAVLSGPIGGFALVLLGRWIPRTALCSWLLSVYNLLPMLPLDGGRALEILVGKQAASVIDRIFLIFLSLVALYVAINLHFGILPLAIIGGLWLKHRKSPCKPPICRVQ